MDPATVCRCDDVVSSSKTGTLIVVAAQREHISGSTAVSQYHEVGIALADTALTGFLMNRLEGLTVWVVLAFVLWLAITLALHYLVRRRVGAGIAAPVLSWLIAGAALSMMAPLLHWLHSHL